MKSATNVTALLQRISNKRKFTRREVIGGSILGALGLTALSPRVRGVIQRKVINWIGERGAMPPLKIVIAPSAHIGMQNARHIKDIMIAAKNRGDPFHYLLREKITVENGKRRNVDEFMEAVYKKIREGKITRRMLAKIIEADQKNAFASKAILQKQKEFLTELNYVAALYGLRPRVLEEYTPREFAELKELYIASETSFTTSVSQKDLNSGLSHVEKGIRLLARANETRNIRIRRTMWQILEEIKKEKITDPELKKAKKIGILVSFGPAHQGLHPEIQRDYSRAQVEMNMISEPHRTLVSLSNMLIGNQKAELPRGLLAHAQFELLLGQKLTNFTVEGRSDLVNYLENKISSIKLQEAEELYKKTRKMKLSKKSDYLYDYLMQK